MASPPDVGFHIHVLRTLESLGIPYVVIGAFAGTSYGVTRATFDVDIVVDMDERDIQAVVAAYPPPRYYADPEQMRDSIRLGIMFNIIDSTEGRKADLVPVTMPPGYAWALRNRIRRPVPSSATESFEAWFARPEDVILGKLMAWMEGRSLKHESDIRDILVAIRTGEEPELTAAFRIEEIDRWVATQGGDAAELWRALKEVAGPAP